MTANIRFLLKNKGDLATMTAIPAVVATLPVTNLQIQTRDYVMRTTSTADQQIIMDFPNDYLRTDGASVNCMILGRHNFSRDATVLVRCYDGASGTGNVLYESSGGCLNGNPGDPVPAYPGIGWGALPWGDFPWGAKYQNDGSGTGRSTFVTWFGELVVCRSMVVTLSDSTNASGFIEVGRLMTGVYREPNCNMDYGVEMTLNEDTKQIRLPDGSIRSDAGPEFRALRLNLSWLNGGERELFHRELKQTGLRDDLFVSAFPEDCTQRELDYSMICKLSRVAKLRHPFYGYYSLPFELEET